MKFITFFVLFIALTYADPSTTVITTDGSSWEYTSIPLSEVNTDEEFYNLLEYGSQKVIIMTIQHYELTDLTFTANVYDISTYTFNGAEYYKFQVTLVNGQGITIEATFVVKSKNGDIDLFSYEYNVIIPAGVEVKSDSGHWEYEEGEYGNEEGGNEYTHEEAEEEEEKFEEEVVQVVEQNPEQNPEEERDKEEEEEFEEEVVEEVEENPVEVVEVVEQNPEQNPEEERDKEEEEEFEEEVVEVIEQNPEQNPEEERDKEEEEFEEEVVEVVEENPVEETVDDTISSTCKVIPNCKRVMVPGQGFKDICTYQTVCF
jgi:hypothetical protein